MPPDALTVEAEGAAGFFGKLPSRGDFLTRRLQREFVDPWDRWLQEALASSREQLGDRWLDLYLTAPIWRFALSPGICGTRPVIGLLMPSVDSVGRFFPLTIAQPGNDWPGPAILASSGKAWFDAAEELALAALEEESDFEAFETGVGHLSFSSPRARDADVDGEPNPALRLSGWRFGGGADCYGQLVDTMLEARFPQYCVWWTDGSPQVAASLLVSPGLPPIRGFTALVDGQWAEHGWAAGLSHVSDHFRLAGRT